jgi:RimJ/RimL family protein N-acetyltransferase
MTFVSAPGRLILRPPTANDFERFFAIYSDPATSRFNPAGPLMDREEARTRLDAITDHWREHGYGKWAIATIDAPEHVIGFGGIVLRDDIGVTHVNLGYRFDATELGHKALSFGHQQFHIPEIFAFVMPAHAASVRVLEKIGMTRVGTLNDVLSDEPILIYRSGLN